ncbi:MAG: cell division FtsA domain-containing protein [Porphyromonas sp.]|nr:cell division FtsA domain-containing protein [Porphyromonas sp.]
MQETIFAVINLGSSYISGMIASRLPNGRINPRAYYQAPSQGIIHGCIHNINDVATVVDHVVDRLNQDFSEGYISSVYVGLDCQSMRSHTFKAQLSFEGEGLILDQSHIQELQRKALDKTYVGQSVLHITEPRYYVDGRLESKPRGVRATHVEACYQIITVRKEIERSVYDVFEQRLGLSVADILVAPIAEANVALTKGEMMQGCAYINIGGGTTSISVYHNRLLTALCVLPLGGDNVTRDLQHLKLLEADAEQVKLRYGSMNLEVSQQDQITANNINGTGQKSFLRIDINRLIHARMTELTTNIFSLLQELAPEAPIHTLAFSGGATQLRGYMDEYLPSLDLPDEGFRQAAVRHEAVHESVDTPQFLTSYHTVIGLVSMATIHCMATDVASLDTLLDEVDSQQGGESKSTQSSEQQTATATVEELQHEEERNYEWDNRTDDEEEDTDTLEDEELDEDLDDDEEEDEDEEVPQEKQSLDIRGFFQKGIDALDGLFGGKKSKS